MSIKPRDRYTAQSISLSWSVLSHYESEMSEKTGSPTNQQQQDLNHNAMAGQNDDFEGSQLEKDAPKPKNSLEKYCAENPSASECLIYEE